MMLRLVKRYFFTFLGAFLISYLLYSFILIPVYRESSFKLARLMDSFYKIVYHDNLTCYENDDEDSIILKAANVPQKSIFFIETSCQNVELSLIKACAIESAARLHPDRNIFVIYMRPYERMKEFITTIKTLELRNIIFCRDKYAGKHKLLSSLFLKNSRNGYKKVLDILKILTLQKYKGITVLDLELILTKSLNDLISNWIALDDDNKTAIVGLNYDKGKRLADHAFDYLNNLSALTDDMFNEAYINAYKKVCPEEYNKVQGIAATENCHEVKVLSSEYFYPIKQRDKYLFYNESGGVTIDRNAYGYHIWEDPGDRFNGRSLLVQISEKFCPKTKELMVLRFVFGIPNI